jgi:restriction system protein
MAIPNYETIMLPLLHYVADGAEHPLREITAHIADLFELTPEERERRLPSGQSTYIQNRTGWAKTYLKKAGLLSTVRRGLIQITDRGREVLANKPDRIDGNFLGQFQEFNDFRARTSNPLNAESLRGAGDEAQTPEETIQRSYMALRSQLVDDLLERIKGCSSDFFERLVVDLIVAMGYGGSQSDAARATQRSNDGGIDGIIKQDRLGLDTIYIQAKRWDENRPVHRPEIQKFAGALQGVRAHKGIFLTTSSFSDGAREYVANIDSKIVLIDGSELAELMIDHGLGVSAHHTYELKKLDGDYFEE